MESKALKAALIGKAGEALVAAELLRRHIDVAYPAFDGGVDLIAYHARRMDRVVPIQVKARTNTCYEFQRSWFNVEGLFLVQVWHVVTMPKFYIFENLDDVEVALGPQHTNTLSWSEKGAYTVTHPSKDQIQRMEPFGDPARWNKIVEKLGIDMS